MGEIKSKLKEAAVVVRQAIDHVVQGNEEPMSVVTPGGRIQVNCDRKKQATTMGQLTFFAEFLEVAGLFERWVQQCPLQYSSPNAPKVRDVLGTWLLSILDGQSRYAHVASLRGDAVIPELPGMNSIVGDESLRRGLALIAPTAKASHNEAERKAQQEQVLRAANWMKQAMQESVQHALSTPWILDADITVKTLFGHQRGAEIGYNPKKPGRPSHTIHTYWVANLRLVAGVQVQGGKAASASHTLPGLHELITGLPLEQRPFLVRGDCGFGNEGIMTDMESIHQPYLFKLKQSSNVKRLIARLWKQRYWCDVGQGWQACEDTLTLQGWSKARRVIVMRHAVRGDLITEAPKNKRRQAGIGNNKKHQSAQTSLCFIDENEPAKLWEYAVLVTNTDTGIAHMGQLYRDRADCENGFDELKNQWGWGGYSTQDMERCNLSAQAVALIYNWWSWYVRLAHPQSRLEAITSRPLLLAAVGRLTGHGGQKRVLLSITHAAAAQVKALVANVRTGLAHIRATAPQLQPVQRWRELVHYIVNKILVANQQNYTKNTSNAPLLSG